MSIASLPTFDQAVGYPLTAAGTITTLQINIGLRCNLACKHCHVESSPKRSGDHENMSQQTAERILAWLENAPSIRTVDFTGGSPEMNPYFKMMVRAVRASGRHVLDRCNPTILTHVEPDGSDYRWAPAFLAENQVEIFASLPCYLPENVRKQRGMHAYDDSIEGLKMLCAVGYGTDPTLPLNLVYNPVGAKLPPPAESLEPDYREYLRDQFGIEFTRLITITNMPIARWADHLERTGERESYDRLLAESFNAATVDGLMCRHQIHIDSSGRMSDCDFHFASGIDADVKGERYLWDVEPEDLANRRIPTVAHCFGCTAGGGSSCGGTLDGGKSDGGTLDGETS